MKSKKIGMVALAIAMGSVAHAENLPLSAIHHTEDIGQVKNLVDNLDQSADKEEYEAKLETIRTMLDNISTEEMIEYHSSVHRCDM